MNYGKYKFEQAKKKKKQRKNQKSFEVKELRIHQILNNTTLISKQKMQEDS